MGYLVKCWPQDNHRELGVAVGKSYRRVRATGENDIGSILMSIATDLEAFDFRDAFTGNFEVACGRSSAAAHHRSEPHVSQCDARLSVL
jgi:hypothetical protein